MVDGSGMELTLRYGRGFGVHDIYLISTCYELNGLCLHRSGELLLLCVMYINGVFIGCLLLKSRWTLGVASVITSAKGGAPLRFS